MSKIHLKMLDELPLYVKQILDALEQYGEAYLVGGCVRDALLNKSPKDYDITTNASIEEIQILFKNYKQCKGNFAKHGTVSVIVDGKPVDVSSYRTETMTLKDDLYHRDFTINSMAYSRKDGLIDYYNGREDLSNRVIKSVGECHERFIENGTRIMRAIRFKSQLGFRIEKNTERAIHQFYEKVLIGVAAEQIERELRDILTGPYVFDVLTKFRDVISFVLPPLKPCLNFIQNNKYHIHHNLYEHIIHVASLTKPDYETRLAALLHDVGKPNCYSEEIVENELHGHFYGHAHESTLLIESTLDGLKVSNKTKEEVLFMVENHDYQFASQKSIRRLLEKTPHNDFNLFLKLMDLRFADRKDHQHLKNITDIMSIIEMAKKIQEEIISFKITDLEINGLDVMKFGFVGKNIGNVLKKLHKLVLDKKIKNDKQELLLYIHNNQKTLIE